MTPFRSGLCGCRNGYFKLGDGPAPCPRCRKYEYVATRRATRWSNCPTSRASQHRNDTATELYHAGEPLRVIAKALGVSITSAQQRLARLGLMRRGPQKFPHSARSSARLAAKKL